MYITTSFKILLNKFVHEDGVITCPHIGWRVNKCIHLWGPEGNINYLPLPLFFSFCFFFFVFSFFFFMFLRHCLSLNLEVNDWIDQNFWVSPSFASQSWHYKYLVFYINAGDVNSGPPAYATRTLPTEPICPDLSSKFERLSPWWKIYEQYKYNK